MNIPRSAWIVTERTALIGNVAGHRASPNTDLDILLNLLGRALPDEREAYPISTRVKQRA